MMLFIIWLSSGIALALLVLVFVAPWLLARFAPAPSYAKVRRRERFFHALASVVVFLAISNHLVLFLAGVAMIWQAVAP